MNEQIENTNVTEMTQARQQAINIVPVLIQTRKEAGISQSLMAEWLGVSRKKLNQFEKGKFDFLLLLKYAEKLSVEINLTHIIH